MFVAGVAFSRAWAYSGIASAPHDAPGPLILTDGGKYLGEFAALWAIIGLLALFDAFVKDTGWSDPLFVGMLTVWGLSYLLAWIASGYASNDWMTFGIYTGCAGKILFDYLENNRKIRAIQTSGAQVTLLATETIPVVMEGDVHIDKGRLNG